MSTPETILDSLKEHVVHQDKGHRILWLNRAAYESVGMTFDEVVGRFCYEIWANRSDPCPGCPVSEAIETGQVRSGERSTPDGREWSVAGYPLKDDKGDVIGAVEVTLDITDRVRVESALRQSEEKYRSLIETLNEGIAITEDHVFTFVNRRLCEMLGCSREELLGRPVLDFVAEESRELMKRERDKRREDQYEVVWIAGDGRRVHTLISPKRLYDSSGARIGSFAAITDISLLKQVEEALRESEERYRSLVELAPVPIFVYRDGRFVYVNPMAVTLHGAESPEDLIGRRLMDFVHPDFAEVLRQTIIKARTSEVRKTELKIVRLDGEVIDIRTTGLNVTYMGEPAHLVICMDITDLKKAEEEVRKKNEELETAMRIKNDFMSMISHELRSPLVPIMGYAELLVSGSLGEIPPEAIEPLNAIRDRADDLARLIDDLLLLSRAERGKLKLDLNPIPVGDQIKDIIVEYESMRQIKPVSIKWTGEDFKILADQTRFHQVLRNLIENAIKYSGDSVEISISTNATKGRGRITVTDNGLGISGEHLPHVFDRFYQVENGDTRSHGGTGLGLAIIRELVKLMGGSVTVESEAGKGSVFTVVLPLAEARDETPISGQGTMK